MQQRQLVPGLMLIALGVLFLLVQQAGWGGEAVVAVIGAAFLVGYAFTRHYGLLVPGGIMTGLGAGIIYETQVQGGGAPVLLGLGLGFISIYAIDAGGRRHAAGWWPLIPGGVLCVIGLLLAAGQRGLLGAVARWWPVLLILLGLYLLWRARSRQPSP